jgi:cob(I)alamin adenosyltransferase
MYAIGAWATAVIASPDSNTDMQFIADDLSRGDYGPFALDALGFATPCVSGLGKVDDVISVANKAIDVQNVDEVTKAYKAIQKDLKVHGNSLNTTKEAIGYALKKMEPTKL